MARFLEPLLIRELPGEDRRWMLEEPCLYYLGFLNSDEWVEAPVRFITDFGSIPPPVSWLPGLSPFGRYRRAYVIHDKLFQAPVVRTFASVRVIDFAQANAILEEAMGVLGASRLTRAIVQAGVRSDRGRAVWDRYRAG